MTQGLGFVWGLNCVYEIKRFGLGFRVWGSRLMKGFGIPNLYMM